MIYVMSDIHGNKRAFDSILNQINLKEDDKLYILGDIIDRQEYGIELIQQIMKMDNVYMLLGNHEYMMMDALGFPYDSNDAKGKMTTRREKLKQWFSNGGDITCATWMKLNADEKEEIKKFLLELPLNYTVEVNGETFKLVHAAPAELYDLLKEKYPDDFPESKTHFCIWERELIQLITGVDKYKTIFGHTPTCNFQNQIPLEIYKNKNIIGIDCGAAYHDNLNSYSNYRLACLRLDDMKEFYSK